MLREQASHDEIAVLLAACILTLATVELIDHPLRQRPFLRLHGRNLRDLVRVLCHVIRERVGELGREGFATLDSFCSETKCGGLKAGIAWTHA